MNILTQIIGWTEEHQKKLASAAQETYQQIGGDLADCRRQMGGKNEEQIPGVTTYLLGGCSPRQSIALIKNCLMFIGIDSFGAHAAASVGKRGVAL